MPEWTEADDREILRLGDALAGSRWPEFVDLADRQITSLASRRYSPADATGSTSTRSSRRREASHCRTSPPPAAVRQRIGSHRAGTGCRSRPGGWPGPQPLRSANSVVVRVSPRWRARCSASSQREGAADGHDVMPAGSQSACSPADRRRPQRPLRPSLWPLARRRPARRGRGRRDRVRRRRRRRLRRRHYAQAAAVRSPFVSVLVLGSLTGGRHAGIILAFTVVALLLRSGSCSSSRPLARRAGRTSAPRAHRAARVRQPRPDRGAWVMAARVAALAPRARGYVRVGRARADPRVERAARSARALSFVTACHRPPRVRRGGSHVHGDPRDVARSTRPHCGISRGGEARARARARARKRARRSVSCARLSPPPPLAPGPSAADARVRAQDGAGSAPTGGSGSSSSAARPKSIICSRRRRGGARVHAERIVKIAGALGDELDCADMTDDARACARRGAAEPVGARSSCHHSFSVLCFGGREAVLTAIAAAGEIPTRCSRRATRRDARPARLTCPAVLTFFQ